MKKSISLPVEIIVILILSIIALTSYVIFFKSSSDRLSESVLKVSNESANKLSNASGQLTNTLSPYVIKNKLVIKGKSCTVEVYNGNSMFAGCIEEICSDKSCTTKTVGKDSSDCGYKCVCYEDKKECLWIK